MLWRGGRQCRTLVLNGSRATAAATECKARLEASRPLGGPWTPRVLMLTLTLVAAPPYGWTRLRRALAHDAELPPPLMHAATVASGAVVVLFVDALAAPKATVASVTVTLWCAVASYVGAATAAAWVAPRLSALVARGVERQRLARHGAAAALPLVASGVLQPLLPHTPMTFIACALTGVSSYLGAKALLDLSGLPRLTVAAFPAALASVPPLGVGWLCFD